MCHLPIAARLPQFDLQFADALFRLAQFATRPLLAIPGAVQGGLQIVLDAHEAARVRRRQSEQIRMFGVLRLPQAQTRASGTQVSCPAFQR